MDTPFNEESEVTVYINDDWKTKTLVEWLLEHASTIQQQNEVIEELRKEVAELKARASPQGRKFIPYKPSDGSIKSQSLIELLDPPTLAPEFRVTPYYEPVVEPIKDTTRPSPIPIRFNQNH